jgi:hypothetical protein
MKVQSATLFALLCTIVAFVAIIVGWFFVGSPSEVRLIRVDAIRAADLASTSRAIANYRLTHESLPRTLDELQQSQPNVSLSLKDPVGQAYEYAVKDSFAYELCATFDRATDMTTESARLHSMFEKHGLGRQCFSLEARPRSQR